MRERSSKSKPKGSEYEEVTGGIVNAIIERVTDAQFERVGVGLRNHVVGASEFPHQIDVSVHGKRHDVVLVECKCWSKPVKPEHILAFAARVYDIRQSEKYGEVEAIFVTKNPFSRGIRKIGKFFKIELAQVISPEQFSVKYREAFALAVNDSLAHWRDKLDKSLKPRPRE